MAYETSERSDTITEALSRWRVGVAAWEKQFEREKSALEFQVPEKQWPEEVRASRGKFIQGNIAVPARPMLSIATLDEPIQLVLNARSRAHLGAIIAPLSPDATDDTAETIQGIYRGIERDSKGDPRGWAYDRAVKSGRGWYRVDKVYDTEGGHPFDQKLILRRILYQGGIVADPMAQEPDWSDGEWLLHPEDMRWSTYKRKFPESDLASYSDSEFVTLAADQPGWIGGTDSESRVVRIAEYWRIVTTLRTQVLLDDNSVAFENEIPVGRTAKTEQDARSREVEVRQVMWSRINCHEELDDPQEWDGQYIPYVFVLGKELQPFDNERRWTGMIENAKDGARLTNYAASGAVEMAALEPKAPFQLDPKQIEGFEQWWAQSNTRNWPYLPSHSRGSDGQPFDKPTRTQVDISRLSPSMELLRMGRDFVQSATSTYDPALGKQPTAHRSGRALIALQDQTVEGTSNYLDNLANISMTHEARIVLDLIPHVYDRPGRIARVLGEDGKSSSVILNAPFTIDQNTKRPMPAQLPPGADPSMMAADQTNPVKHYDLNKGRYGVTVTIGKSYQSKQQEGETEMGALLQADPSLLPIIGPEYFQYRAEPWSQSVAKLLRKMRDHNMPWLSDNPQQGDPQQLAAENQQLKQGVTQMAKALETKQVEQQGKLQIATMQEQAETQRARESNETKKEIAALTAKVDLSIAGQQALMERITAVLDMHQSESARGHEAEQAAIDRAHEAGLTAQDHAHALEQQAVMQPPVDGAPSAGVLS